MNTVKAAFGVTEVDFMVTYNEVDNSSQPTTMKVRTVEIKDKDFASDEWGVYMRAHSLEGVVSINVPKHHVHEVRAVIPTTAATPGYA